MNRRSIFKGVAGGIAAVGANAGSGRSEISDGFGRNYTGLPSPEAARLIDPAKQAAIALLQEQREREDFALTMQIESLERLRSVSAAFVAAKRRELLRKRDTLQSVFYKALGELR